MLQLYHDTTVAIDKLTNDDAKDVNLYEIIDSPTNTKDRYLQINLPVLYLLFTTVCFTVGSMKSLRGSRAFGATQTTSGRRYMTESTPSLTRTVTNVAMRSVKHKHCLDRPFIISIPSLWSRVQS